MTLTEAESLFQQGKYDEAARAMAQLAAPDPFAAVPRLRIGQMHFRFRRFSEAASAWDQLYDVLVEKPLQLNNEVAQLGPEVITLEDLLPFAAQYPPLAQVGCLVGDAYLGMEDWNRSLTAYSQALKSRPDCLPALKGQAQCHIKLREYDKARRELLDYLEESPRDAKAYRLLAMVARAHGWHDQQMNLLHCALLIAPGHLKSLDSVSRFLEQQSRQGEALRLYQEALAVKGDSPELLNNLARLELEISKQNPVSLSPIKRAIGHLQQSLNLEPNQTQMQVMLSNLRDLEQQTAPLWTGAAPSAGLKPAPGAPLLAANKEGDEAEQLHYTSSAILPDRLSTAEPGPVAGTPAAAGAPAESIGGPDEPSLTPTVSKSALSAGLAESISMLPAWERESQVPPHQLVEDEVVEPVSLGLEVVVTPEKIAELIERARAQQEGDTTLAPPKPKGKLFAPPPESVQALQPPIGPLDIAQLVRDAETDEAAKPAALSPAVFKPGPAASRPASAPVTAFGTPLAVPRVPVVLRPRVDRKLLRTPVKRAGAGRKGAKSEMLSAWQLKKQSRSAK